MIFPVSFDSIHYEKKFKSMALKHMATAMIFYSLNFAKKLYTVDLRFWIEISNWIILIVSGMGDTIAKLWRVPKYKYVDFNR